MTGSIATTAADKTADDKPRPDVTKTPPGGAALTKGSALLHTEEQEAFQPGSTPANQRARYLVSTQYLGPMLMPFLSVGPTMVCQGTNLQII